MDQPAGGAIPRRDALLKMAAATVAATATSVAPSAAARLAPEAVASKGQGVIVFRLSTRRSRACRACDLHHRYRIYISHARADRNRPHPGCNCPITMERLPKE